MRFSTKQKHLEERVITKFALFPIICKRWDRREIAFLETVNIRQRWYAFYAIEDLSLRQMLSVFLLGGYWENKWFE